MGIFNMVGGGGDNGDPGLRATQGPAPYGFHVPTKDEWTNLINTITSTLGLTKNKTTMQTYLKMPSAGYRRHLDSNADNQGYSGSYWSSTCSDINNAYYLSFNSSNIYYQFTLSRTDGLSVRCFKNTPINPLNDSNWGKTYSGSGNAGIYYNKVLGLISISGDGVNWTTIADKNLGATSVYNDGDTLSEANCGGYFQWGNNYMFPWTGTVATSTTLIDASTYGPGNYYESSTFIIRTSSPYRWDSTDNRNLRGGVDGNVPV